ncbi:integrase core domain-containing protein [Bradyrhizobium sp. CSA112]|uniref:integrase core domain-containing protein n=1 Tax=Bradyrhizobium sp. CSA112 TaxID=2699170 RepID=UPI0023AEAA41|nr:integrase core domain-containing protein [Bradyrhizobium sp. CSA112]
MILRHQLNVLQRKSSKRPTFGMLDRLIFAGLYRLVPKVLGALAIVKPETVIKWHRAGFRSYWRWKSRRRGGRPTVAPEIRKLIREMSIANPLWGAPRIHGELLKIGIDIGQTSVAKYTAKRRDPPSQGWRTFFRNHADDIAAMDLFVVPTISFRLLYGLLIVGHGRRQILWFGVTAHPTAEWIANQITEACGWEQAPRYLIHDRDGAYDEVFIRRLRSMGIRDRPTSPRSPWENGYAERLIGSIRRECLDHVVVFSERHLRHLLLSYMKMGPAHIYPWRRMHPSRAPSIARRAHSLSPNPGRAASPICPDLIYDRHRRASTTLEEKVSSKRPLGRVASQALVSLEMCAE